MAKNKNKIVGLDGNVVTSGTPDIVGAINGSDVAQQTVAGLEAILNSLGDRSVHYSKPAAELFAELTAMGVDIETTTRMYAALKQAYLTTIYVVEGNAADHAGKSVEEQRTSLVTSLFSLLVGNAIFFRMFNDIPPHRIVDVAIIVTNIMFQMEAGNDGESTN